MIFHKDAGMCQVHIFIYLFIYCLAEKSFIII